MNLSVRGESFQEWFQVDFKFIQLPCPVCAGRDFKFPPADLVDFHSPTNLEMVQ